VSALPSTFVPAADAAPYAADPASAWRVKLAFRIDFTNGGYLEGRDFLLDLAGDAVAPARAAEMLASSMNLLRAGPVTIQSLRIVRRGEHDDAC
jgi:hypothetical protein